MLILFTVYEKSLNRKNSTKKLNNQEKRIDK